MLILDYNIGTVENTHFFLNKFDSNYTIDHIQKKTKSFQCFCGNSYGKYGNLSESKCACKCSTSNETCGCSWSQRIFKNEKSKKNSK